MSGSSHVARALGAGWRRTCAIGVALLALTVWCTADAWADEPTTTTVTVQVPSRSATGVTTVTIEVRPNGGRDAAAVRIASDAEPAAPTITHVEVDQVDLWGIAVDSGHAFEWNEALASSGCGPHPAAGTPACAPHAGAAVQVAGEQATATAARTAPSAATPAAPASATTATAPAATATVTVTTVAPVTYTVQPGDALGRIAQRFYGDPGAYARIAEANAGRIMPDGQAFDDADLIRPGWTLLIPQPTQAIVDRDGARFYTVQRGDTLTGIAATMLGDGRRWTEIDSATPNLIVAGTQLRLPQAPGGADPHPGGGDQQ